MKIFIDCLPCMLKQVLNASRMAGGNEEAQENTLREAIGVLADYPRYRSSPELAEAMHKTVKKFAGTADPYKAVKQRDIAAALEVYPFLKNYVEASPNPLNAALKVAAAGNMIDSAIASHIDIAKSMEEQLKNDFGLSDEEEFAQELKQAKSLLIIGDNAGETVFDRVLIEYLPMPDITYAARDEAVINDATVEDAYASGLDRCAAVISTGCGAPGAVLERCSREFLEDFYQADLVVSKGQGNFEALSDCEREVYFLLKAKCPVISQRIGVPFGDCVFFKHKPRQKQGGETFGKTG